MNVKIVKLNLQVFGKTSKIAKLSSHKNIDLYSTQIRQAFTVLGPLVMELYLHNCRTFNSWNKCVWFYTVAVGALFVCYYAMLLQFTKWGMWTASLGTQKFCFSDTSVMAWLNRCILTDGFRCLISFIHADMISSNAVCTANMECVIVNWSSITSG